MSTPAKLPSPEQEPEVVPSEPTDSGSESNVKSATATVHPMGEFANLSPRLTKSFAQWLQHPLTRGSVALQTPSIRRLFQSLKTAAKAGRNAYFSAHNGDGITTTLEAMRDMFDVSAEGIVTFYHALQPGRSDKDVRRTMFSYVQSLHMGTYPAPNVDLASRAINRFLEVGRTSTIQTGILFLDNVHNLTEPDLTFLSDLADAFKAEHMKLLIFSGGYENEIRALQAKFDKKKVVLKKYLGKHVDFTSVRSASDVAEIFELVDTERERGTTYTSFFVGDRFSLPFRLTDEADNFTTALETVSKQRSAYNYAIGVPLRSFFTSILLFFHYLSEEDSPEDNEKRLQCWVDALEWVEVVDALGDKHDLGIMNGGIGE